MFNIVLNFWHLKHSTPKKPLQPRYKIFWGKNWMGLREGNRREPNIFGIFPGCFWIGPMSPNPSPYRTQRPLFPLGDSVWRNAFLLCWEGTGPQSWTDCRGGQTCAKHSLAPRDVFATRLVRSLRKSHSQIKNCMDVLTHTFNNIHPATRRALIDDFLIDCSQQYSHTFKLGLPRKSISTTLPLAKQTQGLSAFTKNSSWVLSQV